MLESVTLCVFPLVSGALVDEEQQSAEGYKNAELFFIVIGGLGVLFSFGVFIFPNQDKRKLDESKKKREKKQKNKKLLGR